jgi:hypothetical protein
MGMVERAGFAKWSNTAARAAELQSGGKDGAGKLKHRNTGFRFSEFPFTLAP